jgi:uncharacterized damage-inducible protein DinB
MSNRILTVALALAVLSPGSLHAQDGPVVSSLKGLHDITTRFLTSTADLVSEDLYAFQPTEEVRTLGQILAHVANAQYLFCSAATGEPSPNSENFEETRTTKAEIMDALTEAFAYCDGVYANMSDEDGATMRQLFGQEMAASAVLAFNSAHNYEHYGNLVTYMRINGITPPSSM